MCAACLANLPPHYPDWQVGVAAQFGLKPVLDYGDPNLASLFESVSGQEGRSRRRTGCVRHCFPQQHACQVPLDLPMHLTSVTAELRPDHLPPSLLPSLRRRTPASR